MQITEYRPLILAALFGSTLAGVTGFGGAAILLPVLVHQFGPRDAIPILTVAQLIGNGSRVYFHRGFSKMAKMPLKGFIGVGLAFSFLSALVGSVGPFIVPFFLSYGLVKGAFIGTEAMATVIMHVFKLVAYHQGAILTVQAVLVGLALGPLMVTGSWLGKKLTHRMPEKVFAFLVELTLIAAGLNFLVRG